MDREMQPYKQTPKEDFIFKRNKVYAQRTVEIKKRQAKKAGCLLFELLMDRDSLAGSGKHEVFSILEITQQATDHQHTVARHRHVPRRVAHNTSITVKVHLAIPV
jgi:hypothetical protein